MRQKIIQKSEAYHTFIHVLLGLSCALYININNPGLNMYLLAFLGIGGNLWPDLDHILYWFVYGRSSEYSKIVRKYLGERYYKLVYKFVSQNHKDFTGVYSHNLLTFLVVGIFTWYFFYIKINLYVGTLFLSWSIHYLFDIAEDLLFKGKINPNWYFKFDTKGLKFNNFSFFDFTQKLKK